MPIYLSLEVQSWEFLSEYESCSLIIFNTNSYIFLRYRHPQLAPTQENQFVIDPNDNGKRKTVKENNILSEDLLMNPQNKKRRLNDSISVPKRKSYMDMQMNNLTIFKDSKPDFNFTAKSPGNSSRTTPERVRTFGNFLCTPVVNKKTPPKRFTAKCPPTPVSILKTRSMRGSLSPGRLSEFGDDNKSVKSITFAAMPDSRDTSFNESSNFEDTSAEAFYSPDKFESPRTFEAPKARKPIGNVSHSNSPSPMNVDNEKEHEESVTPKTSPRSFNIASTLIKNLQNISQEVESFEKATNEEKERKIRENESKSSDQILSDIEKHSTTLNTTVESEGSIEELIKPYRSGDVLKGNDEIDTESSMDSEPDQSIINLTRHSVIESKYGDLSDSQDERSEDADESVDEEHYEEEQLPEHGEISDEASEYGEVDLDDSSDIGDYDEEDEPVAESPVKNKAKKAEEVICLDSSSEDDDDDDDESSDSSDVEVQPNLPAFTAFSQENPHNISSQEEMCAMLYEDMEADDNENVVAEEIVIEEPRFEEIPESQESKAEEPSSSQIDSLEQAHNEAMVESHNEAMVESNNVTLETEYFVSASGGDLNVALIDSQIDSTTQIESESKVCKEITQMEEHTEVSNVLNQAVADIEMSVDTENGGDETVQEEQEIESCQQEQDDKEVENINTRSMRSRSASTARDMRGQSVPTNGSSSPKSARSTRASTEEREKPKRKNVKTLEIIHESATPVSSPGMLTRKRSQLSLTESIETPTTPTVLTRRRSMLMEEGKSTPSTPTTPKRITRAVSKESLSQNEPEDAATLTRRGSLRKRTTSASDNDDAKSSRSARSTRKSARTPTSSVKSTLEKQSPSTSEATETTSLSNRRLTRKQMQVIEKSKRLMQNLSQDSSKTTKKSDVSESDNESVTSPSSVGSSRASRKRKATKSKDDDDAKKALPAIPEEGQEGEIETSEKKRQFDSNFSLIFINRNRSTTSQKSIEANSEEIILFNFSFYSTEFFFIMFQSYKKSRILL